MKYNTQRKKLEIAEYGRNVQEMIQYLYEIEDKDTRSYAARQIIDIMAQINPDVKEHGDWKHKLWDHLFLIAGNDLDVDAPYPKPEPDQLRKKPEKMPYQKNNIRFRHYGQNLMRMIEAATKIEDKEEREQLTMAIAQYMKMSYRMWNEEKVADDVILNNLKHFSQGQLKLDEIEEDKVKRAAPSKPPRGANRGGGRKGGGGGRGRGRRSNRKR